MQCLVEDEWTRPGDGCLVLGSQRSGPFLADCSDLNRFSAFPAVLWEDFSADPVLQSVTVSCSPCEANTSWRKSPFF